MKLPLLVLLAASAGACAKNNPAPVHASSSDHHRAPAEVESDLSDRSATDSPESVVGTAPRRSHNAQNASADGYVPPTRDGSNASASDLDSEGAADNTAQNKADREFDSLTPLDQGESAGDRETTQNIRKAVIADDSLSFTAKNVKIITNDGRVTLRGPVKSAQERDAIAEIARRVAGGARVDNQLQVTSD